MHPDDVIDLLDRLHPLWELPRTGWLLRGIRPCESLAEHSFGVALVTMAMVDALREEGATIDGERVLRMALLHDAPEAATGDVPMPVKTAELKRAMKQAEAQIADRLLPAPYARLVHEVEAGESLEARIVKAADKVQMMIRAHAYEAQGRGRLDEFWENPGNFRDQDLSFAKRIFDALRARAGR